MRKRSTIKSCKIHNCKGKPNSKGVYVQGFCTRHYGQYRVGTLDLSGKPKKKDNSEKTRTVSFNKIIRRTTTIDKKVLEVNAAIEKETKEQGNLFVRKANKSIPTMVSGMSTLGKHLRTGTFIFGNIEGLHNDTLKGILTTKEPTFDTGVPCMKAYDVVQIVKLLRQGYSLTRISRLYKGVGMKKLQAVQQNYERGVYPITDDMTK